MPNEPSEVYFFDETFKLFRDEMEVYLISRKIYYDDNQNKSCRRSVVVAFGFLSHKSAYYFTNVFQMWKQAVQNERNVKNWNPPNLKFFFISTIILKKI